MNRLCCVCGADNYEPLYKPEHSPGPVVRCKVCDFVYVNPIETDKALITEGPVLGDRPEDLLHSADLDAIKGSWEEPIIEAYLAELRPKQVNAEEALTYINQLAGQRGKILDYGCFCGVFLSVAQAQGWDAYGIEPLVMPSIYARGKFGLKVTTDTLRHDTFPADFFDVVTAFQVFEHIVDPQDSLEKIRHIIKPGGLIAIEVPNIENTWVKVFKEKHRHFVEDHVSFFSAETLKRLLERFGFQPVGVYYPVRALSYRHFAWWIGRFAGKRSGGMAQNLVSRMGLDEKTINLSFGDIVMVIARKP